MILESFTRLLDAHCTPAVVRAAQTDPSAADPLRAALAESGFLDVLLPEAEGGAGLSLPDFAPLVMAAGRFLLPVPFAEPAVERLSGSLSAEAAAALTAARTAGVCQRIFEMTVDHVTTRTQFGRAISSFQAIQHQVAVMAEELAAATLGAHIGMRGPDFSAEGSAIARVRCAEAAEQIAATAHQLHGAIGATAEHDLQLWTTELRRLHRSNDLPSAHAMALGLARVSTADTSLGTIQRILR
jgi:acyl-CoA dehydrogenase